MMGNMIMKDNIKHDKNGNLTYYSDDGHEHWYEYNKKSQVLHYKTTLIIPVKDKDTMDSGNHPDQFWEFWKTYDRRGRILTYRDTNGFKHTYKYDKDGEVTRQTNSVGAFEKANLVVKMHDSVDMGWSFG